MNWPRAAATEKTNPPVAFLVVRTGAIATKALVNWRVKQGHVPSIGRGGACKLSSCSVGRKSKDPLEVLPKRGQDSNPLKLMCESNAVKRNVKEILDVFDFFLNLPY